MSLPFAFSPEARQELQDAVRFYERKSVGLGAEFAEEVRTAVDQIVHHPSWGAPSSVGTRPRMLRRFPYSIIYLHEPGSIEIIAVVHQRRDPGYWQDRL